MMASGLARVQGEPVIVVASNSSAHTQVPCHAWLRHPRPLFHEMCARWPRPHWCFADAPIISPCHQLSVTKNETLLLVHQVSNFWIEDDSMPCHNAGGVSPYRVLCGVWGVGHLVEAHRALTSTRFTSQPCLPLDCENTRDIMVS